MSSTANRVIKNTGFLYAKMGITMFISLYTTRLILNSLGASDFGIFNIVGGAISMLGFLNAAMAGATQRFMSYSEGEGDKEKQKTIFNISFVLHTVIAFLVVLVLTIAGYFFFNGILNIPEERVFAAKVIYSSLIVSTMFTVMTVPYDAVMNAHENMKYYAVVGVLESLLKLSVAFVIVYTSSDKLIIYGILMSCIPLVTLSIMRIYCHRNYNECIIAPRLYWDRPLAKEMGTFAGWNLLGNMSSMVGNYGYGIVVNHFFGTIVNAALGIANQMSGQLMVFSNTMMKALNPVIVKSEGAHNRVQMFKFAFVGSKFSFLLLAIFAIPFIVEAPYILKLWLKNVPEWTILFLRLQLIRSMLEQLTSCFTNVLNATGRIHEMQKFSIFSNLSPLIVLSVLYNMDFPPYWLYIIAIAFMVILNGCIAAYISNKYCMLSMSQYFKSVITPVCVCASASLIVALLPLAFMKSDFLRLITVSVASGITFVCALYYIGLSEQERNKIMSLVKKINIIKNRTRS